jgi:hypothetical protein
LPIATLFAADTQITNQENIAQPKQSKDISTYFERISEVYLALEKSHPCIDNYLSMESFKGIESFNTACSQYEQAKSAYIGSDLYKRDKTLYPTQDIRFKQCVRCVKLMGTTGNKKGRRQD